MSGAEPERRARWRLVLGSEAEGALGEALDGPAAARDRALGYLYDREAGEERNQRRGTLDESSLSVPEWINDVHELFPRRVVERLERDALDRYGLLEIVTRQEVLARATPNVTLLKAVLATKHLMSAEVLGEARRIIRAVVEELLKTLAREVRSPFTGALDRRRPSAHRIAANFDAKATIRHNLKHYDAAGRRIVISEPRFSSRVRRHVDRWRVIVLVDQSGSMADSVIHAAVTASIFHALGTLLRTHLAVFDTNVVDLTDGCGDPVETLMKVQLGGGTDIGQALRWAEGLIDRPDRTIVVLITDFGEGADLGELLRVVKRLVDGGVTLLGLAALDERAVPGYDRDVAERFVALGAHVGAMTPHELAEWVAEKVR
jgi:Mg-chelatase subunit ChlD